MILYKVSGAKSMHVESVVIYNRPKEQLDDENKILFLEMFDGLHLEKVSNNFDGSPYEYDKLLHKVEVK